MKWISVARVRWNFFIFLHYDSVSISWHIELLLLVMAQRLSSAGDGIEILSFAEIGVETTEVESVMFVIHCIPQFQLLFISSACYNSTNR